jgi:hypothetical protein
VCEDSTKADWSIWSYEHYRRLMEKEVMEACRVYAEVELADLPASKGEEAKMWLTSTHQETERTQEHIGERIKRLKVLQALLCPATEGLSPRSQRKRARTMAIREIKGAKAKPKEQAEEAAARARLQAARATGTPEGSQLAGEAVVEPHVKARGPALLRDPECKICAGETSGSSIVSRAIAQGAEEEGDGEAGSEATVQGAGESSESDDDEGNSGFRSVLRARADSSPTEVGDRDEETPALGQSPEQGDEFARELASIMSAIANLVVKATGRSVSNGGWLFFSGAREDYRPFRARCQLFQETYHGITPPKLLVGMFREWNLSGEAARHIKGAEDMKAAWGMLDAVYDGAPAQGSGAA